MSALNLNEIEHLAASKPGGSLLVSNTIPALIAEVRRLTAERDAARAALTRVEALCDEADARNWAKSHDVNGELFATVVGTGAVRAALAIPEPGEQGGEQ